MEENELKEMEQTEKTNETELNNNMETNDVETIEEDTKKELGLHTIKYAFEKDIDEDKTKFYYGSLRSGQKLEYDGSIVIIGDVNSGAEVFATGNIAVLGSLRGIAHAGATGNTKATLSAMNIDAPQIRIANIVEELQANREQKRETAHCLEKHIVIED